MLSKTLKQVGIGIIATGMLIGGLASTSFGSSACPIVTSGQIGASNNDNRFYAVTTENAGGGWLKNTGKWIILDAANSDAMLATLLTAKSLTKTVQICTADGDYSASPETIVAIYMRD